MTDSSERDTQPPVYPFRGLLLREDAQRVSRDLHGAGRGDRPAGTVR
jgi:hypothetical protein